MTEIEKLLAVLDMTEEEQYRWAVGKYPKYLARHPQKSLAELAFKLRDEVVKKQRLEFKLGSCYAGWDEGLQLVFEHLDLVEDIVIWATDLAQPIHWIIASLIAKQLAKDK